MAPNRIQFTPGKGGGSVARKETMSRYYKLNKRSDGYKAGNRYIDMKTMKVLRKTPKNPKERMMAGIGRRRR